MAGSAGARAGLAGRVGLPRAVAPMATLHGLFVLKSKTLSERASWH
jgi:hypothetical protein